MRVGGAIGKNFLLAKILSCMVLLQVPAFVAIVCGTSWDTPGITEWFAKAVEHWRVECKFPLQKNRCHWCKQNSHY